MKIVWDLVNGLKIRCVYKTRIFISLLVLINMACGGLLWVIVGRLFLPGPEWLFCFMSYSAIFLGYFCGIIYVNNHRFI